jgi:hypothetical protein
MKLSHFVSRDSECEENLSIVQGKLLLTLKAPLKLSLSRSCAPADGAGNEYSTDTSREDSVVDTVQLPSVKD